MKKGFSSWNDACRKFDNHQKSESVLKVVTLPATSIDGAEMLSSKHDMKSSRIDTIH